MRKLLNVFLALIIPIVGVLGITTPVIASTTYESYAVGNYGAAGSDSRYDRGQTFVAESTHMVHAIGGYFYRDGSPGTATLALYETVNGLPTNLLTYGTFNGNTLTTSKQSVVVNMTADVQITSGVKYAIILLVPDCPASNPPSYWNILFWGLGAPSVYTTGRIVERIDDGAWAESSYLVNDDYAFTIYGDEVTAPVVTTGTVSDITTDGGTLSGSVTTVGSAGYCNVTFQYGTTTAYGIGETAIQNITTTGSVTAAISGLAAGTVIHYRIKADGITTTYGDDATFTIATTNSPTVVTVSATDMNQNSVTLTGNLTDLGNFTDVTVYFQYGTTSGYGNIVYGYSAGNYSMNTTGLYNVTLTTLSPSTNYHFRAMANYNIGQPVYGNDMTFGTTGTTTLADPIVNTLPSTGVTNSSAVLNGDLFQVGYFTPVKLRFGYRQQGTLSWAYTAWQYTNATGTFNATISNLAENTFYEYQAIANNQHTLITGAVEAYGNIAPVFTGTGGAPFSLLVYPASNPTSTGATLTAYVYGIDVNATATVYFKYGLGTFTNTSPAITQIGNGTVSATITGLVSGSRYTFTAYALVGNSYQQGQSLTFDTLGITATPAPTLPGGGRGSVGPFTLPDDWVTSGTSYIWLVLLMVAIPFLMIYLFESVKLAKAGAVIGAIADIGVFIYWVAGGWVHTYLLVVLVLICGVIIWKVTPWGRTT